MTQGGDAKAGFSTTVDRARALVHSRCWGFWDERLAAAWQADALASVQLVRGPAWGMLADLDGFVPQRPAVQEIVRTVVVTIASLRPRGAVLLASNAITKLQLVRLLREEKCGVWSFRSGADEALEWLAKSCEGGNHVGR